MLIKLTVYLNMRKGSKIFHRLLKYDVSREAAKMTFLPHVRQPKAPNYNPVPSLG